MRQTLLLIGLATVLAATSQAQLPYSAWMKPGPAVGEDAYLFNLDNGCVPNDGSYGSNTPGNVNFGAAGQLPYMVWTWNAIGCPTGTIRSVIRFSALNSIASNSIITNATLTFFGVPTGEWGAHSWPSSSSSFFTNPGWIRRITAPWNEATITWNNFNASANTNVTTAGQIAIPASAANWGWGPSIDVTPLVQGIVNGSFPNYGWQLSLQTEGRYRGIVFASSDHRNADLWPELSFTVTPCANFEYCFNSINPNIYTYTATNPISGYTYTWNIGGNSLSGTSVTFDAATLTLPPDSTSYTVVLTATGNGNTCSKSHRVCRYNSASSSGSCAHFSVCTRTTEPNTFRFQALYPAPTGLVYKWGDGTTGSSTSYSFSGPMPAGFGWMASLSARIAGSSPGFPDICKSQIKLCYNYNMARLAADPVTDNEHPDRESGTPLPGDAAATSLQIAPNPSDGYWNIRLQVSEEQEAILELYDLSGKLIRKQRQLLVKGSNQTSIDGRDIAAGMYLLTLKYGDHIINEKLIRSR